VYGKAERAVAERECHASYGERHACALGQRQPLASERGYSIGSNGKEAKISAARPDETVCNPKFSSAMAAPNCNVPSSATGTTSLRSK
jgi:hypothetical protein